MSFRTILVPIEQHDLMSSTLETALCLAQKFSTVTRRASSGRDELLACAKAGDFRERATEYLNRA